jgi:hypothetical protein
MSWRTATSPLDGRDIRSRNYLGPSERGATPTKHDTMPQHDAKRRTYFCRGRPFHAALPSHTTPDKLPPRRDHAASHANEEWPRNRDATRHAVVHYRPAVKAEALKLRRQSVREKRINPMPAGAHTIVHTSPGRLTPTEGMGARAGLHQAREDPPAPTRPRPFAVGCE